MRAILAILAIALLSDCSASFHVKRARRLDPTMFQADTIVKLDTIKHEIQTFVEQVRFDTLIQITQADPITNTEYVVRYRIEKDSIFIDCPDPIEIVRTETITEIVTIKPTFWEQVKHITWVIAGLALIGVIWKVIAFFI